jgi:hypothetical protein
MAHKQMYVTVVFMFNSSFLFDFMIDWLIDFAYAGDNKSGWGAARRSPSQSTTLLTSLRYFPLIVIELILRRLYTHHTSGLVVCSGVAPSSIS